MPAPFHWSIRTQARVAACLAVAAVTAGLGAMHIDRGSRGIVEAAGDTQVQGARRLAENLSSDLALRMKAVTATARSEVLRDASDSSALRKPLEALRDSLPVYGWVGLLDNNGTVIAATGEVLQGRSLAARPVFQRGRESAWTGDVHEAGPLAGTMPHTRGQSPMLIDLAAPITAADGSPRGVLAVQMSWQWARRLRAAEMRLAPAAANQQYAILDASGQTLLAAERADMLESRLPPRNASDSAVGVAGVSRLASESASLRKAYPATPPWAFHRSSEGSPAVLSATVPVPASADFKLAEWRVQATADASFVATETRHLVHDTVVFAVLGAAVASLFACWLIGAVAKPLDRMNCSRRSPLVCSREGRRRSDMQVIADSIVAMQRSIDDRQPVEAEAGPQVLQDPLTGLWSRTYLQQLADELLLAAALRPMEICVVTIDLDDFRSFNERHGQAAGDHMLKEVATRMRALSRHGDIGFRLGGDDFMLLLPCPVGEGQALAARTAHRLAQDLGQPVAHDGASLQIDCSVGTAVWRGDSTLADAMGAADVALYSGRCGAGGHDRVSLAGGLLAG
ncbi:MAG: hypothetical protein JWQ11_4013 [Rhizobacter sp.]|nr:hypothetical protein [Rhizobacter sp.]